MALAVYPRSAHSQAAGLSAAYSMDEGSGTTISDKSGNSNTGTLTNGPTWTTGKYGGALLFDGVNDRVRVNDSNSLDTSAAPPAARASSTWGRNSGSPSCQRSAKRVHHLIAFSQFPLRSR